MANERVWHSWGEEKAAWGPGPWQQEPDKVQWRDEGTGLPCLIVRGPMGNLCGYVGVYPGHPFHGIGYSAPALDCGGRANLAPDDLLQVHGGVTFSDFCADHELPGQPPLSEEQRRQIEAHGICHLAEPGEPAPVWWFGFDCGHAGDLSPHLAAATGRLERELPGYAALFDAFELLPGRRFEEVYRDLEYVRAQVRDLAAQLKALGIAPSLIGAGGFLVRLEPEPAD